MASIYANGAKGHHKFTLTVSETSTSQENNTSAVSFQFTISPVVKSYDWRYWGNSISYTVTVNGVAFTGTIPDYDGYSTVILKSGSLSVPHNDDGTKVLPFGFTVTDKAGASYTCGNASAEGTMDLTRILRNPPTLTVAAEDCNPDTVALTGDKGTLVRYFSSAAFTLEAVAHDGATVESRTVICGGRTLSGETGVFEKTESGSFVFTAADSYGNSASETLELPLIPYIPLTCNLAPTRPDAEGHMALSVSGNCFGGSFGATENALKVFCRCRETDGDFGVWTEISVRQTGNSYAATGELTGLDHEKAYVFQAKAEDLLDTAETPEYTAKAIPVFDWGQEDFNINGTLKMHGIPVADFIVEQGVSENWTYRKWSSGTMECWANGTAPLSYGGQFGGLFFGYGSVAFCSGFVGEPTVHYSVYATSSYDFSGKARFSENQLQFYVGSTMDLSKISEATFRAYAVGKWK